MSEKEEQDLNTFVKAYFDLHNNTSLFSLIDDNYMIGHKIELLNAKGEKIRTQRDDTFPYYRHKVTFNYVKIINSNNQ